MNVTTKDFAENDVSDFSVEKLLKRINEDSKGCSKEEFKRREQAAIFSRNSVELEGFKISSEAEAITKKYIHDFIGIDQYITETKALHGL